MDETEINQIIEAERTMSETLSDYCGRWVAIEAPPCHDRWVSAKDYQVIYSADDLPGILSIVRKEEKEDGSLAILRIPENLHLISNVF